MNDQCLLSIQLKTTTSHQRVVAIVRYPAPLYAVVPLLTTTTILTELFFVAYNDIEQQHRYVGHSSRPLRLASLSTAVFHTRKKGCTLCGLDKVSSFPPAYNARIHRMDSPVFRRLPVWLPSLDVSPSFLSTPTPLLLPCIVS
jgi:hypothetical protein